MNEELVKRLEELDPSDDYHNGEIKDEAAYYAAVDRCIKIVKGELKDWRDKG